jgi:cell division protein FtsB
MIYRVLRSLLSIIGLCPVRERDSLLIQVFRLEKEADDLKKEVGVLADENKALWDMIDELQGSKKINPQTVNDFVDDLRDAVMEEMLKDFEPVGEA